MKRFVLVIIFVLTLSSIASKNVVSGEIVVETARTKLGARYVYGAIGPNVFDCSGFVQWCFMQHGISLPRTSSQQSNIGVTVDNNFDSLRVGDIVCFNRHVGIYIGVDNNKHRFIHASTSNGVMISALEDKYWSSRYKGARRLTRVQYVSDDGTNSKNITELSSAPIAPKTDIALPPSEGTYELSTSPKPASRFWKNKIKRKDRKTVILKDKKNREKEL